MKQSTSIILTSLLICLLLAFLTIPQSYCSKPKKVSGAGQALDAWALARAYPNNAIPMDAFNRSWEYKKLQEDISIATRSDEAQWKAIGPKNIGGRTLCLAFNPQNTQTLYAGSASGGLWRSYTAGVGVEAWHQVKTGFPVLGVSSIVIHPQDSNIIYIGTGEVYNYQNSAPGVFDRLTRGTYGIGILKSIDGGNTWTKSLDWVYGALKGVMKLEMNPQNPATIYAATTQGLYKTTNSGDTWNLIHNFKMAVDIEIHPTDSNKVFVSHGNLSSTHHGIYRSTNGGNSFTKLTNGLPATYSGKTLLSFAPSNPDSMYASFAETFNSIGLYLSTDLGNSWDTVNTEDVAKWQGWYSHDVAVHPNKASELMYVGIDIWKSTNSGTTLTQKTDWWKWDFGVTPVGGPEGPPDYAHGDIHAIYYHPTDPNQVFFATDGGIFHSGDRGETFSGRNGGYQTTQFYANFSNSTTDSSFAMGGMQDNSTAIYLGGDAWKRVIGGDGMSASIHPIHDDTIFGSAQRLWIERSYNRGDAFTIVSPPGGGGGGLPTSFAGPYEIAPSSPSRIYAGRTVMYRSNNLGETWAATTNTNINNNNPIITIGVAPTNAAVVYIGTAPNGTNPRIYKTTNSGADWASINGGLPNRIPMDITVHPQDENTAYLVYAGFGSSHVFKTTNGLVWQDITNGLPDVPTNTVAIDPDFPDHVYVGNDLGVYLSKDGGDSWEIFCSGLPDIVLVMHLSISPSNRNLRVATHGNGVYQTPLVEGEPASIKKFALSGVKLGQNYPNPVVSQTTIPLELDKPAHTTISLFDQQGRLVKVLAEKSLVSGKKEFRIDLSDLPAGLYVYKAELTFLNNGKTGSLSKVLIKK